MSKEVDIKAMCIGTNGGKFSIKAFYDRMIQRGLEYFLTMLI